MKPGPKPLLTEERFWAKVDASGDCWEWTAYKAPNGYGQFRINSPRKMEYAHRYAWAELVGPIPAGLELDHLCRVRHCVNPDHLEVVSPQTNTLRSVSPSSLQAKQTECIKGHPLVGENLYRWRNHRLCKTCRKERRGSYR